MALAAQNTTTPVSGSTTTFTTLSGSTITGTYGDNGNLSTVVRTYNTSFNVTGPNWVNDKVNGSFTRTVNYDSDGTLINQIDETKYRNSTNYEFTRTTITSYYSDGNTVYDNYTFQKRDGTIVQSMDMYYNEGDKFKLYYSRATDKMYWVNVSDDYRVMGSWSCRDDFVAGTNDEGQPRASLPNGNYTSSALDPGKKYGDAYGLFKILTGDPRARIIHGGGTGSKPNSYVLNQSWVKTQGCLRMKNGDGMMLSWMMISNGNSMGLHVGDSFLSTM
jgi:hypothetical protein